MLVAVGYLGSLNPILPSELPKHSALVELQKPGTNWQESHFPSKKLPNIGVFVVVFLVANFDQIHLPPPQLGKSSQLLLSGY